MKLSLLFIILLMPLVVRGEENVFISTDPLNLFSFHNAGFIINDEGKVDIYGKPTEAALESFKFLKSRIDDYITSRLTAAHTIKCDECYRELIMNPPESKNLNIRQGEKR